VCEKALNDLTYASSFFFLLSHYFLYLSTSLTSTKNNERTTHSKNKKRREHRQCDVSLHAIKTWQAQAQARAKEAKPENVTPALIIFLLLFLLSW
jgi:hypothetical protein